MVRGNQTTAVPCWVRKPCRWWAPNMQRCEIGTTPANPLTTHPPSGTSFLTHFYALTRGMMSNLLHKNCKKKIGKWAGSLSVDKPDQLTNPRCECGQPGQQDVTGKFNNIVAVRPVYIWNRPRTAPQSKHIQHRPHFTSPKVHWWRNCEAFYITHCKRQRSVSQSKQAQHQLNFDLLGAQTDLKIGSLWGLSSTPTIVAPVG